MKPGECILALDLGTSAFKCAAVDSDLLLTEPVVLPYDPDEWLEDAVPSYGYIRLAMTALKESAERAQAASLTPCAIGICSQAQTFVGLHGSRILPEEPAVPWTDSSAQEEAEELANAIADYPRKSGFAHPSPQQFITKVMRYNRIHPGRILLLLDEFILNWFTGSRWSSVTSQGMAGILDISRRSRNDEALAAAGIGSWQLAFPHPAGTQLGFVDKEIAQTLGIWRAGGPHEYLGMSEVRLYLCGNDQCCSAIGAGLRAPGDVVCTFGTAMVAYTVCDELPMDLAENQIAGIDPLTGGWFLLAYESHCGDLLDWAHRAFYADVEFEQMLEQAVKCEATDLPRIEFSGDGLIDISNLSIGHHREQIVFALLISLADQLKSLLEGLGPVRTHGRFIAAGGLSRSPSWLSFLESHSDRKFGRAPHEHCSLIGVAQVIERNAKKPAGCLGSLFL